MKEQKTGLDIATQQTHERTTQHNMLQNPTDWPTTEAARCHPSQTCFGQLQMHLFSGMWAVILEMTCKQFADSDPHYFFPHFFTIGVKNNPAHTHIKSQMQT